MVSTLSPEVYGRVHADPVLGPAIDDTLRPILLEGGPPGDRAQAFVAARAAALARHAAAPRQLSATGEGPGPDQVRLDFDAVCTDLVRGWIRGRALLLEGARDTKGLKALESEVAAALPWDPVNARLLAQELLLRRLVIEESGQGPTAP